jgi:hypothetical protein
MKRTTKKYLRLVKGAGYDSNRFYAIKYNGLYDVTKYHHTNIEKVITYILNNS